MPRSSSWKSRSQACSDCDEVVRESGPGCARFSPGLRGRRADPGRRRVEASAGAAIVDKRRAPRALSARQPTSHDGEEARGNPAYSGTAGGQARHEQVGQNGPRRATLPVSAGTRGCYRYRTSTEAPRQQEVGNVLGPEAAEAAGEHQAAQTKSRRTLRVGPVVARYRLRRRR